MTPDLDCSPKALSVWLVGTIAQRLDLDPGALRTDVRLRRYGLDSLAAVEVRALIEEHTGRRMPATLLEAAPSIDELSASISKHLLEGAPSPRGHAELFEQLRRDAILPASIQPPSERRGAAGRGVLLTGATGFLGAWLLRAVARQTKGPLFCLVRAEARSRKGSAERARSPRVQSRGERAVSPAHDSSGWPTDPSTSSAAAEIGRARIFANSARLGVDLSALGDRLVIVPGDLELPSLGLSEGAWHALADQIGNIVHGAAAVNWTASYQALRDANVLGTLELLRLACAASSAFHFISSLGVAYSTRAVGPVSEESDPLAHVEGVALGYFQSKCVGEAVVREAGRRGLATALYRPPLLWGDSRLGAGPDDDLLTALVCGCVELGCAPDLDWRLELSPVDAAADALIALALRRPPLGATHHLGQPERRHWRELVLALNVFGHRVTLRPFAEWRAELARQCVSAEHPLFHLRAFFETAAPDRPELSLPELFEHRHLNAVVSARSNALVRDLGVAPPPLAPAYLHQVIANLEARGRLPRRQTAAVAGGGALPATLVNQALRNRLGEAAPVVSRVERLAGGASSIAGELTSWLAGSDTGVSVCHLTFERGELAGGRRTVCAKLKARDDQVLAVGEAVAWSCDPLLGAAFHRFAPLTDLAGSHVRELGFYQLNDARLEAHRPDVYGLHRDDAADRWLLVLEHLGEGVERLDSADDTTAWTEAQLDAVMRGLAALHSVGWGRAAVLRQEPWLGQVQSCATMQTMKPLLEAMAARLAHFAERAGLPSLVSIQRCLIDDLPQWRDELEQLPQTLIHNDFNPRNLALRRTPKGLKLCAYDWELATLGVAQHDVMEFLCFALDEAVDRSGVERWLAVHRVALEDAGAGALAPASIARAAQLSLRQLLINRLPVYAMVDAVRSQPFLPRVLRTWRRLFELFEAR